MHTLITGAGGFLSRRLIDTLLSETDATITALDVVRRYTALSSFASGIIREPLQSEVVKAFAESL